MTILFIISNVILHGSEPHILLRALIMHILYCKKQEKPVYFNKTTDKSVMAVYCSYAFWAVVARGSHWLEVRGHGWLDNFNIFSTVLGSGRRVKVYL